MPGKRKSKQWGPGGDAETRAAGGGVQGAAQHKVTRRPTSSSLLPQRFPVTKQTELSAVIYMMMKDEEFYNRVPSWKRIETLEEYMEMSTVICQSFVNNEMDDIQVRCVQADQVPKPVIPGPGELPGEGRAPPGTTVGTPVGASVQQPRILTKSARRRYRKILLEAFRQDDQRPL